MHGPRLNPVEREVLDTVIELVNDGPMEGETLFNRVWQALPKLTKGQIQQSLVNLANMGLIGVVGQDDA